MLVARLGSEGDTHYVEGVCDTLYKKFVLDSPWCRRQTFVFVAGELFTDRVMSLPLYCSQVLPHLLELVEDRVPNVRLAVAEMLTKRIIKHGWLP